MLEHRRRWSRRFTAPKCECGTIIKMTKGRWSQEHDGRMMLHRVEWKCEACGAIKHTRTQRGLYRKLSRFIVVRSAAHA